MVCAGFVHALCTFKEMKYEYPFWTSLDCVVSQKPNDDDVPDGVYRLLSFHDWCVPFCVCVYTLILFHLLMNVCWKKKWFLI